MLCNICHQPELATTPDGVKTDSLRPNANPKKDAKAFICSKCVILLGKCQGGVDWEMTLEELKALLRQGQKMMRTK